MWCLLTPAIICLGLAFLSVTLDVRALHPPRITPGTVVRGCLSSGLVLLAGLFVGAAYLLHWWLP